MAIRFKPPASGKRTGPAPASGTGAPGTPAPATGTGLLSLAPRQVSPGYTRFVYTMKVVLPALAVTLIILVVVWPQLSREDKSFRIGLSELDVTVDDDAVMVNARHVGTDNKQQPYTVTADLARNLDEDGARVFLQSPKADILLEDGTWLILSADEGVYQRTGDTLELSGRVNVFHDSGYEFQTERATIDLADGAAESRVPVRGHGPFGDLTAEGLVIRDRGQTMKFTGSARAVLYPAGGAEKGAK